MAFLRRYIHLRLLFFYACCTGPSASHEAVRQRRQHRRREQATEATSTVAPSTDVPCAPQLLFEGMLRNDLGEPVGDARIQFWHADLNGNYFHPGDDLDGKELMEDSFAYFGTSTSDAEGSFGFKTYRPGIYASRPITHIHFKVFHNQTELLTSQFYFADESVARWYDEMLILTLEEDFDETDGTFVLRTNKTVVVDTNTGGSAKLTPAQTEGPFYPLVDFFHAGNDLTVGILEEFCATERPAAVGSATGVPVIGTVADDAAAPPATPVPEDLFGGLFEVDGGNSTADGNPSWDIHGNGTEYYDDDGVVAEILDGDNSGNATTTRNENTIVDDSDDDESALVSDDEAQDGGMSAGVAGNDTLSEEAVAVDTQQEDGKDKRFLRTNQQ